MVTTTDTPTRNRRPKRAALSSSATTMNSSAKTINSSASARRKSAKTPMQSTQSARSSGRGSAFRHWPNRRYNWSRLQEVMIAQDLTPAMLTERTGFCSNSIYEWLLATKTPRATTFHRLATILGVDATELRNSFPI